MSKFNVCIDHISYYIDGRAKSHCRVNDEIVLLPSCRFVFHSFFYHTHMHMHIMHMHSEQQRDVKRSNKKHTHNNSDKSTNAVVIVIVVVRPCCSRETWRSGCPSWRRRWRATTAEPRRQARTRTCSGSTTRGAPPERLRLRKPRRTSPERCGNRRTQQPQHAGKEGGLTNQNGKHRDTHTHTHIFTHVFS